MEYVLVLLAPLFFMIMIQFNYIGTKNVKHINLLFFRRFGFAIIFAIILNAFVIYAYYYDNYTILFKILVFSNIFIEGIILYLFALYFATYIDEEKKEKNRLYAIIAIPLIMYFISMIIVLFVFNDNQDTINLAYSVAITIILFLYSVYSAIVIKKEELINSKSFYAIVGGLFLILIFLMFHTSIFIGGNYYVQRILFPIFGVSIYSLIYLFWQNMNQYLTDNTQMLNRRMFFNELKSIYSKKREKTAIYVDLLNYKSINNKKGQEKLDMFLLLIADYFKNKFDDCYHISEEEICIIIDNSIDYEDITDDIMTRFEKKWEIDKESIKIEINIIVIDCLKNADSPDELTSIVDGIINRNKEKMQLVIVCDEIVTKAYKRKNEVYSVLKRAIERDEVLVYYQPIYGVKEQKFVGVEALSRIKHNGFVISPGEFIPIAEETGLIVELDMLVFEHTLKFLNMLKEKDVKLESAAINFSPIQFSQDYIDDRIDELINQYNVNPKQVAIEMTESVFVDNYDLPRKMMYSLDKIGIKFHLDDFGVGFSNLSSILNLPFNLVKIDRSLVLAASEGEKGKSILKSLCKTLQNNGLRILIEGVETKKQLDIISKIGDFHIQGFYFAHPMPEHEAIRFLIKGGDLK